MPKVVSVGGHPAYRVTDIRNPSRFHCPACGRGNGWDLAEVGYRRGVEERLYVCSNPRCGKGWMLDDITSPGVVWASRDRKWAVLSSGGSVAVISAHGATREAIPCSLDGGEVRFSGRADVPRSAAVVARRYLVRSARDQKASGKGNIVGYGRGCTGA